MANFLFKKIAMNKMPYEEWLLCQKCNTDDDYVVKFWWGNKLVV